MTRRKRLHSDCTCDEDASSMLGALRLCKADLAKEQQQTTEVEAALFD